MSVCYTDGRQNNAKACYRKYQNSSNVSRENDLIQKKTQASMFPNLMITIN